MMRLSCLRIAVLLLALKWSTASVFAATLQPDESTSKDVFLYEFDVPGVFGIPTPPRTTNLDTATLGQITPPPVPFGNFLGAAVTNPFSLTPGGPLRQHGTRTLIQFDLGSLGVDASTVDKAWLNLYALPALSAFESPTAEHPITLDLRRITEAWGEQTATWENDPAVESQIAATLVQSGVDQWIRFDISDLVRDWLTNQSSNFGVEISQRDVVEIEVPNERDRYFAGLYASSNSADASRRPFLEVNPVPEPHTAVAYGLASLAVISLTRRRNRSR